MSADESADHRLAIAPTELRAPEGAMQMEIDWEDGATSILSHRWLRGFCPCAGCQGHAGQVIFREEMVQGDLTLTDIEPVGQYALRLSFGDGHGTGLYTFRFLRELGDAVRETPGEGMLKRSFMR